MSNTTPDHLPQTHTRKRFTRFEPPLGTGGLGTVYRAYDHEMDSEVALKTLKHLSPNESYRLKREFRFLAGLTHPNLVELYDLIADESHAFFTMELVQGSDILSYIRGPHAGTASILEADSKNRLRFSIKQLYQGLSFLHSQGRLHCDLKPQNALVSQHGRVVLLDFGISTFFRRPELGLAQGDDEYPEFAGTIDYMSPEQAWNQTLSPASDWYAIGALIYEALTGRLPFEGSATKTLAARAKAPPAAPKSIVNEIDEHLSRVVQGLLHPDPKKRPPPAEVLRALGELTSESQAPAYFVSESKFIGRAQELQTLKNTINQKIEEPRLIHITGPSGIGKSALIQQCLKTLQSPKPPYLFFAQCHPQETIPYKGLDGMLDTLSRIWASLPEEQAQSLLPSDAGYLARLFPVLRRLPEWQNAQCDEIAAPEIRRRAVIALREVFNQFAQSHTLIAWMDDVHECDFDSIGLLSDLIRPPDAPPLAVLLTYRPEEPSITALLKAMAEGALEDVHTEHIPLSALSPEESKTLAKSAFGLSESSSSDPWLLQSDGNPFLVLELARTLKCDPEQAKTKVIGELIGHRLHSLDAHSRRLLELVAISGRPLSRGIALRAAHIPGEHEGIVPRLRMEQLLRTGPSKQGIALTTTHDRIREHLLAELSEEDRKERHHALALAMEAHTSPDPEALLFHFLGAEEPPKALHYALIASERAFNTLAFARAASHYEHVLRLTEINGNINGDSNNSNITQLYEKLAQSYAYSGRPGEAAKTYSKIATFLDSSGAASREAILAFRRHAAEQYLRGGQVEEGKSILKDVLAKTGISYPNSIFRTLMIILAARIYLAFRGFEPRLPKNPPQDGPGAIQKRLDAYWSAGLGLNMVDLITSAAFQARHSVLALNSGDLHHTLRALGTEISYRACEGGAQNRARAQALEQKARSLLLQCDDIEIQAFIDLCVGVARFFEGKNQDALEALSKAERVFSSRHDGLTWEVVNCWMYQMWAWLKLGDVRMLYKTTPDRFARIRGDHSVLSLSGTASAHGNMVWLLMDKPEEARANAELAMEAFPKDSFQTPQCMNVFAHARIDLYENKGKEALRRLALNWPRIRATQLLRMQIFRIEFLYLRAGAALACAWEDKSRASDYIGRAKTDLRRVLREDHWSAPALAQLLEAGIEFYENGLQGANTKKLEGAARTCEELGLSLHAAAARVRAGHSEGFLAMERAKIKNPRRLSGMLLPGGD